MSASQPGTFNVQEFTDLGAPLVGGRLYTYAQGTTTQKTAYTDAAGTIPHTYTSDGLGGQYIALNTRGELPAPLYLAAGSYDLALKTAAGATVWTRRADPVGDIYVNLAAPSGASLVGYSPSGTDPSSTVQQKLDSVNLIGNSGRRHFSIGCVPRCAAGVFSLIDDSGHHPMNVASVTQPDAFNIRINYAQTATKINTFVVGADDALAPYGVVFGGDVGNAYANILAFAPFSYFCDHNTPTPFVVLNPLWAPSVAAGGIAVSKPDAATTRVTHPASVTNDAVVATIVGGSALLTPVVSFSSSQVDVIMHSDAQGYIAYNGSAWAQSLSDNLTAPGMTWTASNTLKVDHGVTGSVNKVPMLTGHGGVYVPQIANLGATYFEVAFYDYAGTKITTPNASMQFWYRRSLLVPTIWPDSMIVSVKRGLCQVPSANFSNVAGNNLWVMGDMEY